MRNNRNTSNEGNKENEKITNFFQDFIKGDLENYCEAFMASIHYTKCHICDDLCSCLPIHIPLITSLIFICSDCLSLVAEQLDVLGNMQEYIETQIKAGRIREEGGNSNNVSLIFTDE